MLVLLAAGVGLVGLWLWRRSARRQAENAERARADEAARQVLNTKVSALAADVARLEPEIMLHRDAQSDLDAGGRSMSCGSGRGGATRRDRSILSASSGSWPRRPTRGTAAQAVVQGREPPPPPEHLRRPGRHGEPAVTLDERRRPTYIGYPGGFEGGWFGGTGGSLFTGLLLGSMFAGGWGGETTINHEGDFGGGDFGGGDFGGGATSGATSVAATSSASVDQPRRPTNRLGTSARRSSKVITRWLSERASTRSRRLVQESG